MITSIYRCYIWHASSLSVRIYCWCSMSTNLKVFIHWLLGCEAVGSCTPNLTYNYNYSYIAAQIIQLLSLYYWVWHWNLLKFSHDHTGDTDDVVNFDRYANLLSCRIAWGKLQSSTTYTCIFCSRFCWNSIIWISYFLNVHS